MSFTKTVSASSVDRFDHEADVLVLGFGCAGASAAYEAATAGASVLVLERAGAPGGASEYSGGELYLGGGTSLQRSCGYSDTPEEMFSYLSAALGPHADEEKLRLYCDGSVEHYEWLCARGLTFEPSLYDAPTWMPPTRDGLMWLGENAWPYNQITRPVPRGHRPSTESWGGWMIMEKLTRACTEAGVQTHCETVGSALIVDEHGRVVGVSAQHFGEELHYRARRGVVITTGGFVDNEEMLTDHAPALLGHGKVSAGRDDGSGITMAMAAGGAVRRMSLVEVAYTALPAMVCHGMLVNARGSRFINEDVYPGLYSQAALQQPRPCWVILDEQGLESIPRSDTWGVRPEYAAETLPELEADLNLPAGSLVTTVEQYNEHAEAGEDRLFHKDKKWLRRLEGPWAAVDPRIGFGNPKADRSLMTSGFAGFTLGGLRTTVDGEVLTLAEESIPGLYAAGRATSGVHGQGYISGTSLGDGTFFGRRAGRAVVGATATETT